MMSYYNVTFGVESIYQRLMIMLFGVQKGLHENLFDIPFLERQKIFLVFNFFFQFWIFH